ncbi:ATPase [Gemmata sp. G18]|uniref:ATPase n=1 Tax=Gemmata palustris TaxID=2822762 RepID=A0ABS5BNR0_9BACT|nr:ATPase [Gemmata palustris]MBP3955305.1 ATPase [Gemmata palustris]
MSITVLALASYFKGNRFLERLKAEGCTVYLLTVESALKEAWNRGACDEVFAVGNFHDRRALINAVAYLMRGRKVDRIVALDDFDVEVGANLREHFRMTDTGHGESVARFFRDKLAMRTKAREIGVRIPDFCPIFNHDDVRAFLARVPGPWLVKPRSEASAAGIRKLKTADEVWKRIDELGDDQSFCLIEQMVPGDLFHVDSLCADGRVVFAEVNAYWRPLLDVYQGGGVYATRTVPRDRPEVDELKRANAQVLEGFGLGWGASHTEFMKAHADGQCYFIETSARVGGANTAEMVEHATGVNLWSEWAKLELCRGTHAYAVPPLQQRFAGVVISLARQEHPDTSGFTDPEIVYRMTTKNHIGFVVAADTPQRVEDLLTQYMDRITRDFHAVLPASDKVSI